MALDIAPRAGMGVSFCSPAFGFVGLAAGLALLPWLVADYQRVFFAEILIWGLFAMSFAMIYGFGGMLSFAQAVFFGFGCWGFNLAHFITGSTFGVRCSARLPPPP